MAYLNVDEAFSHLRDQALEGIRDQFSPPIKGKTKTLHLIDLEVDDKMHADDIHGQQKAKMGEETWGPPVFGTFEIKDNATGEVLSKKRIRVAELPKTTRRYSYIVDGQEYQVDNQWQLKPGVYARRQQNGELEARFQTTKGSTFDKISFDPKTKKFVVAYKKATAIPLYPIMQLMGVKDEELEKSWGKDVLDANKHAARGGKALEQFYKTGTGNAPPSKEAAEEYVRRSLLGASLLPDVTSVTLGKPFDHVSGEALHAATNKLLAVQRGAPEDDRDNLVFKNLRSTGDFVRDKLYGARRNNIQKIQRQLNNPKAESVSEVMRFDFLNEPIKQLFTKTSISNQATQINPLQMVSTAMQTTIMGPGGIQSDRSVSEEAKMINPSHLGFLDPIHTPEGSRTGVTLRLPMGLKKKGNDAVISAYNLQTGKQEDIGIAKFLQSKVVLPDQVAWKDGKPVPVGDHVRFVDVGNRIEEGKFSQAHYVLRDASQLFNVTSNLIPFLGNDSGGRAGMASRHMEQAVSLVDRAVPLVQVGTGVPIKEISTFEKLLGHQSAHHSPVDGTVTRVSKDGIHIKDAEGKEHEIQLYNNYPLNDSKSVMHSMPVVKAGDKVKAKQLVADTNFSKDGTLALGTTMRVAYVPFHGYNFEDGIVISDSAAQRFASEHLHKPSLRMEENTVTSPKKYSVAFPTTFRTSQYNKLDDAGVVKVGQKVHPGDPLILAMRPFEVKERSGLAAVRKSYTGHHNDNSVRWGSDFEGEVVSVHKTPEKIVVHVKTVEPMQIGDKISNRHGAKGIVTTILPDEEMPQTKEGKPLEVLLNPVGVGGRMNIGQVLETAASKIALKTGQPYVVRNFDPHTDNVLEKVREELKQHGLSESEELVDPKTKLPIGKALVGSQYMLKLVHQVEKKLSVRSGMGLPGLPSEEHYDAHLQPSSGGGTGGQSLSALGFYALLSHGAKATIREMQTWKSEGHDSNPNEQKRWPSQHIAVWKAIQEGTPLPPPKTTYAFQKFTDMLKGAGINVEKRGHQFVLGPLTDKQILNMSGGELTHADKSPVRAKEDKAGELVPMPGGLFDEKATGGHGGTKFSHITLAEPVPNPVFEHAIRSLTRLKGKEFDAIVSGLKYVDPKTGKAAEKGLTGGAGIKAMLDKIDVKSELESARKELTASAPSKADAVLKKVKYLTALTQLEISPSDAYILHHLPVVPPVIRPLTVMHNGGLRYEDSNGLYKQFDMINKQLQDPVLKENWTDSKKSALREAYYDGVKAVMGVGTINKERKERGFLDQISGDQPKTGYFQSVLMNRRQDMTMRSTIIPEPSMGLDEVGLPKDAALTLYRPFVIRQLVLQGTSQNPLQAQKLVAAVHGGGKDPMVWRALDRVMEERPVLLKRDPMLHKYSIQALKAKAISGNAIKIHPLVTGGFNADFDGDTMAAYVPISQEAVTEARKMFPSNNIFSEASGHVMYQPTLESALGLYKLSLVGAATSHKFDSKEAVAEALKAGTVKLSDTVALNGKKTTPGRVLLSSVMPDDLKEKILHDLSFSMDKNGLSDTLSHIGDKHRHDFGRLADGIKDIGYDAAYGIVKTPLVKGGHVPVGTHSFSFNDFAIDNKTRSAVLDPVKKQVAAINGGDLSQVEKDHRAVALWMKADEDIKKLHTDDANKNPSNLYMLTRAGIKPSWAQYKQMVLSPLIYKDSADRDIPLAVTRNYSEGLDLGSYWTQLYGARRGAVMKTQEVSEPGALSKLLVNTSMSTLVEEEDCHTHRGASLSVHEPDIHDRFTATPFTSGNLHVPAGTLLTPTVVGQLRTAAPTEKIVVRSPLKCAAPHGICQKCLGISVDQQLHPLGTNIGVISAQAVGERAVQLMLKNFHGGGVSETGAGQKVISSFDLFQNLTKLPKKIPNAASIAMASGKVEKIVPTDTGANVWINGKAHFVGRDAGGNPLHTLPPPERRSSRYVSWQPPEAGAYVEAGQTLSDPNRTIINPHDLYHATGSMDIVQNHLVGEMHKIYEGQGIRRRLLETLVKSMSNLTKVVDPGDHPFILKGEFHPTSVVRHINETDLKDKQPILHKPVLKGVDMLPLSIQDDWMAKMQHSHLKDTLLEAASQGLASNLHGSHPIPGAVFGSSFGLPDKDHPKHHY